MTTPITPPRPAQPVSDPPLRFTPEGTVEPDGWEPLDLVPWPVTYPVHLYPLPVNPQKWTVTRSKLTKTERALRWIRERAAIRGELAKWRKEENTTR